MNKESSQIDPNTIIDTPNSEKQLSNRNELQSNNNRNTSHTNHTEQTVTQEEEMNIENLNWSLPEKKTRLPLLRNHDWRAVTAETEK